MSDPKPVHVGEVLRGLRANDHNAFYETWRWRNQQTPPHGPDIPQNRYANRLVVTVRNEETIIDSKFPVLALTRPLFDPDDREHALHQPIAFAGETPTAETTNDEIAIIQGPIDEDRLGHGVINGYTYCMVHWTDEDHTHCRIKVGDNTQLESAASGIKILAHEEVPDPEYLPVTLWALINLGGGSGINNNTIFAIVWEEATANLGMPGLCIILNDDFIPIDANGEPFEFDIFDPLDDYYDEYAILDAAVNFYSAHQYAPCPVGVRIWLSSPGEIVPGAEDNPEAKVKGLMTEPADYYQTFPGAGAETGLTGAEAAEDQQWTGEPCPTPET